MIEVANLSSKGQLVIPKDMREEIGLESNDKVVLVSDNNTIILKKIKEDGVKEKMKVLVNAFGREFKKAGITKEDLDREIKAVKKAR